MLTALESDRYTRTHTEADSRVLERLHGVVRVATRYWAVCLIGSRDGCTSCLGVPLISTVRVQGRYYTMRVRHPVFLHTS